MSGQDSLSPLERRSFLSRLSAGVTAFAAAVAGGAATGYGQSGAAPSSSPWQPLRHEKDDWMDKVPGRHRMVFDTTTPDSLGNALAFANNFIRVNRNDYGLQNSDMAVIVVVRHNSTGFGYNDAIWAKWGVPISKRAGFVDPKTNEAAKANLYNIAEYGAQLPNRGNTLEQLFKMGVQLAVCATSTRGIAGAIAEATGGNTDNIFNELVSNLVSPNARMVPAGIVAVNRAQERGYAFVG
jgi:intracellular sulfur oxidation DsrE/DsrF family protein